MQPGNSRGAPAAPLLLPPLTYKFFVTDETRTAPHTLMRTHNPSTFILFSFPPCPRPRPPIPTPTPPHVRAKCRAARGGGTLLMRENEASLADSQRVAIIAESQNRTTGLQTRLLHK